MRSLLMAALILLVASPARAQDSLPRFVFSGHHIGEARVSPGPRNECKQPGEGPKQIVCVREKLDDLNFDAWYSYDSTGRLRGVGGMVDSVGFEPLLHTFEKRYGQPSALGRGKGHDYAQWRFQEGRLHLTRTGTMIVVRFAPSA